MEKVAFLGVAVAPPPPSLRAQLGLPQGTGLLVMHVEPESGAAGKVQENDVLTRFNDQLLVNPEQLTVLVGAAAIGSEVKLTLIRTKTEQTIPVKLGEREVPKGRFGMPDLGWWSGWNSPEPWQRKHEDMVREWKERAGDLRDRAEERMRDLRERREQRQGPPRPEAGPGQPGRGEPREPGRGDPGRNTTLKTSTWVEEGLVLNLIETGGSKRLTVEKNGQKVFEGPIDTEEQRQKVPQEYREKLDKMEAISAPAKDAKGRGDIL